MMCKQIRVLRRQNNQPKPLKHPKLLLSLTKMPKICLSEKSNIQKFI